MKIVIDVSNELKAKHLIDILKDIPYVKNIKVEPEKIKGNQILNQFLEYGKTGMLR